jgi:WD40 repeat protein
MRLRQVSEKTFVAQIFATDVSASGEYIAVLSADRSYAYIHVLDINDAIHVSAKITQKASHQISLHNGQFDMSSVRIAISSDGTYVALYESHGNLAGGSAPPRFPFYAFQFRSVSEKDPPKGPIFGFLGRPLDKISEKLAHRADYTNDSPEEWGRVKEFDGQTISQLKGHFTGYGKFLARDKFKTDNEVIIEGGNSAHGDYFVAINESRINVYDVDNNWKPLFGHNIGDLATIENRRTQLRMLHQSISGPQFVWLEDKQNVSVWDLETGSNIKYISVNNPDTPNTQQDIISHLAVSPGGKLLALAGDDWIRTYFMDSCIEICKTTIKDGSVLSIEFTDQGKNLLVTIEKPSKKKRTLMTEEKPTLMTEEKRTLMIMDALNLSSWHIHMTELPQSFYGSLHIAQPSTAQGRYGVMMTVNQVLRMYDVLQPGELERAPMVSCQGEYVTNPSREPSRSAYSLAVDFKNRGHESDSQAYSQTSSFDINIDMNEHHEEARMEHRCHGANHSAYSLVVDSEIRKNGDQKQKLARVCLYIGEQKSPIMTIIPEPWRKLDVDDVGIPVKVSFLSRWPQFIITTSSSYQIWNLPCTNSDNQCELALSWVMLRSEHAKFRGGEIDDYVQIIRKTVVKDGKNVTITISGNYGTNTFGPVSIPKTQWLTPSETAHCINSFPLLASCYPDSSPAAQDAILRYIVKHINHNPSGGATWSSLMDTIARSAKWKHCPDILGAILGSTDQKWIPRRCTPTMRKNRGDRPSANPILYLLKRAKTDPYALSMAEQMMDYCIREAKSQCDPAFLHPVSACLPELVDYHPDIAIDVTRRSSLVPIRNKNFVVDRAIVSSPLLTRVLDWVMRAVMKMEKRTIYKYQDPLFQLKSQLLSIAPGDFTTDIKVAGEIIPNPVNHERFREEVYVAPYSLLWHYRDEVTTPKSDNAVMTRVNAIMTWAKELVTRIIKTVSTKQNIIYKAITLGCYAAVMGLNMLNPLHKPTLRLNFRSRKYHESPAIAALIGFKW